MRITIVGLIAAATLAVAATGCSTDGTSTVPTTGRPTVVQTVESSPPSTASVITATTIRVNGKQGSLSYDVDVPQLAGQGRDAAVKEFNDGMRTTLQAIIAARSDAVKLTGVADESKVEYLGNKVAGGIMWLTLDFGGAHPTAVLATHVTNLDTAKQIRVADLFTDETAGLTKLSTLATQKLKKSKYASVIDADGLTPTRDHFQYWTPTPEGMHLYFEQGQAAPPVAGVLDVTIEWSALTGVLKPGMPEVLAG
ncbi:RsiV family protein [Nocardia inohanensis]|uniref:RsiV family protein n=1 Tax=Nocardia inohanensis TaxID=209246 RepID=UPI00082C0318|nr:RsiV family protein [Nocardia inohanensis]